MKYVCDKCQKPCGQVYGSKIDNKYMEICVKCMFPSSKK